MRLELGSFPVDEMEFGTSTAWADGVLEIDREGLITDVLKDRRITSVDLEIASPGPSPAGSERVG